MFPDLAEVVDLLIHLEAPPVEAPEARVQPPHPRVARPAGERLEVERGAGRPGPGEELQPQWREVPAGPFLIGSRPDNPLAAEREKPQHEQPIPYPYRIGRYPVTNAEFARFVEAKGYEDRAFWTEAGWQWKEESRRTGPERYGGEFDRPDHPVVGVSWYEAVAYCNWLTQAMRAGGELGPDEVVRLPTEAEWEKAARSDDGREWPWGDEFDPARANTAESRRRCTTPVGEYSPAGDSPYGCADMGGNVWEWCSTRWVDNYQDYDQDVQEREKLEGDARRVLRGGSWSDLAYFARCAARLGDLPLGWSRYCGFRCVAPVSGF
jgi:formylglycine-generating enzyme required for sulfatase activity